MKILLLKNDDFIGNSMAQSPERALVRCLVLDNKVRNDIVDWLQMPLLTDLMWCLLPDTKVSTRLELCIKTMNFALKMMNFDKTFEELSLKQVTNSVLKLMNSLLKMMNFFLKMMNFGAGVP